MIGVHGSRVQQYLDNGYVVVREIGGAEVVDRWLWIADPTKVCLEPLRGGACEGEKAHRGRHSTVWFECDACGRTRRGYPHRQEMDGDGVPDVSFCFMCCRELV